MEVLVERGAFESVEAKYGTGYTPLCAAAVGSDFAKALLLLQSGADVGARDNGERAAFSSAFNLSYCDNHCKRQAKVTN